MSEVETPDRDVIATLTGLLERKLRLELSTLDLALLALLRIRGTQASLAAFSEEQVFDAFEHACHVVEPGTENLRVRASHALRRLREQQLLVRVDGAGVVRAGEYALSRLGSGIVDFYLETDVLSRESLSPITATLAATLSELVDKARRLAEQDQQSRQALLTAIHGSLDVTCRELLVAIERRQLGLDHQQEGFQKEIAALLSSDWFGSLEHCQSLLDTSAAALNELNEVLMRDAQQLQALLSHLVQALSEHSFLEREAAVHSVPTVAGDDHVAAEAAPPNEEAVSAEDGAERAELQLRVIADKALRSAVAVADQVDRVTSWGASRQKAWTDYYEYVHRYLRDVVRLDPSRALSQRLRQQLVEHGTRPFALAVASEAAMRLLREPEPIEPPPPVRRPRKTREKEPTVAATPEDPLVALELSVRKLASEGIRSLKEVTHLLTTDMSPDERFLTAGRVAEIFARLPQSLVERERPWVEAAPDLSIEQRQTRPFPYEDEP